MKGTQHPSSQPALAAPPCQVGWFTNLATGETVAAKCNSWTCAHCGPLKCMQYRRRLNPIAWTHMLTLTVEGSEWDPPYTKEQIKTFNRKWRWVRQWLRRNVKSEMFCWVNELGDRRGRLHKHILLACARFEYAALRSSVVRAGLGRVMHFDHLRGGGRGGSSYATKYLTKTLSRSWPKGARRVQTNAPSEASMGWTFTALPRISWHPTWWSENRLASLLARTNDASEAYALADDASYRQPGLNLTPREKLPQCPWSGPGPPLL